MHISYACVGFCFIRNMFVRFAAAFVRIRKHSRKDIRSGIRAALGYSPKCKSSITNLRNIFLISQSIVNGRENAYEYQRMSGYHHCDLLAHYRGDM